MKKPKSNSLFHTVFIVPDIKRSVGFYQEKLGFKPIMVCTNTELITSSGNFLNITIVEGADDIQGMVELVEVVKSKGKPVARQESAAPQGKYELKYGFWAVVFEVKDLAATCRDLKAKGVNFVNEPNFQLIPGEARVYSAVIRDIDGNLIELVQSLEMF